MKTVAIFAASSPRVAQHHYDAALDLGRALAEHGYAVLYGGGRRGLMHAVATGVIEKNGQITGVIPHVLLEEVDTRLSKTDPKCHLIETADIEERKNILIDSADVIIALPGGVGTFEELYGAAMQNKPIILFNHDDYYDDILRQHTDFCFARVGDSVADVMTLLPQCAQQSPIPCDTRSYDFFHQVMTHVDLDENIMLAHDDHGTFIAVMTAEQHTKLYKSKQNDAPMPTMDQLFAFSSGIILLDIDKPHTFAALHKMITYNQLGLHGEDVTGNPIRKPMVLLDHKRTNFFEPTWQQLQHACSEQLLSDHHLNGVTRSNNLAEAVKIIVSQCVLSHFV